MSEVGSVPFIKQIRRAVERLFSAESCEVDPLAFSPQQLRDAFIIHSYRRQSQPVEVPLVGDVDTMSAAVFAAADEFIRVRRNRKTASPSVA